MLCLYIQRPHCQINGPKIWDGVVGSFSAVFNVAGKLSKGDKRRDGIFSVCHLEGKDCEGVTMAKKRQCVAPYSYTRLPLPSRWMSSTPHPTSMPLAIVSLCS